MRTINDLVDLLMQFSGSDGVFHTPIPRMSIMRCSAPTIPELVLYEPSICVVAQGVKEARIDDQTYRYDSARYLLGSVRQPVFGSVVKATKKYPYICLRLDLDSEIIVELMSLSVEEKINHAISSGLRLGEMDNELVDTVVRLAETMNDSKSIDVLSPLVEKELIWRLLQQPETHSVLAQMVTSSSRLRRIRKAIEWIESHFTESISTRDLADIALMGHSSFHKYFKMVTGTSPIRFRSHLRLMAARRLMVVEGYDAAEAGFKVGYSEPAQFSREYSKLLGYAPKQDAMRLKNSFHVGINQL
ncbi:AraC family transcriptional regulator [Marinomonas gallaica]|uniref:AraC family transcriptional regulator n=1 Tax=Marinomonas gallaica TaxID=1806667 RepID=UPI00083339AC|nr:AraC family transcriptional regulator [Marinomonas gallaica]